MAIDTMDKLVASLGTSQDTKLFFPSVTNVAGNWVNLNQATVPTFGQMTAPTAYTSGGKTYNQSQNSAGFPRWTPDGTKTTYIGRIGATFATAGTLHIYGLLWACSGFVGNVTTAQTVTGFSGLPTRNPTGEGCEIWIGCSVATGATASNITVQYTNSAGVSGRNTVSTAHITSMPAYRMYQVPLQSGDTGVQSIQSITFSASTGTAGNIWVLIVDRYTSISTAVPNVSQTGDAISIGMPKIFDESCVLFIHQATTTSSGIIMGNLSIIQG